MKKWLLQKLQQPLRMVQLPTKHKVRIIWKSFDNRLKKIETEKIGINIENKK